MFLFWLKNALVIGSSFFAEKVEGVVEVVEVVEGVKRERWMGLLCTFSSSSTSSSLEWGDLGGRGTGEAGSSLRSRKSSSSLFLQTKEKEKNQK